MILTHSTFILIILFSSGLAAGTVDAIAGGGGLISLPVLITLGLPPQIALGTNKLQASVGTLAATINYFRHGFIDLRPIMGGLICGFVGASLGATLAQLLHPTVLSKLIIIFMALIFIYSVCRPNLGLDEKVAKVKPQLFFMIAGLVLGFYDGFFGPGTGSFWAIAIVYFLGYNLAKATAYTKVFNLESNLVALGWFALGHNIDYKIGLTMAAGQLIGGKLGSHLVIKKGAQFVRPIFLTVVFFTLVAMLYKTGIL